jgi:hypothetical protein
MPLGKVNSGDFRKGTPIVLPHQFGNPVGDPEPFGNVEPQSNPSLNSNQVTWLPTPSHFGNKIGFSMQCVPPVIVIPQGSSDTVDINVTHLGNGTSATLTYDGAPTGVTVAFGTNPDAATSIATITVDITVPAGKYVINVYGTAAGEVEHTNIHLTVIGPGAAPSGN